MQPMAMDGVPGRLVPNIVFDGDSLTIGEGVIPFNVFPAGGDYPSQVVSSLDPRGSYYNVGVGGETIKTMITNAPTAVDAKLAAGLANVVVICGGSNDIWLFDASPYSDIVTYCKARKAAGWKVIVGTIGPRADTQNNIPADFEAVRTACNAQIRANWPSFADGIADWGADPAIGASQASAINAKYYTGDGAHLNWSGYAIRADYCLAALAALGIIGEYRRDTAAGTYDAWLPASQLYVASGTSTLGIIPGTVHQAWSLAHGADTIMAADFLPPTNWLTYGIVPAYTRTGSATGTVCLNAAFAPSLNIYTSLFTDMPGPAVAGATPPGGLTVAPFFFANTLALEAPPAGKVYAPQITGQSGINGVTPRVAQKIIVKRAGTDATHDTCTDAIYLLGFYLQQAS